MVPAADVGFRIVKERATVTINVGLRRKGEKMQSAAALGVILAGNTTGSAALELYFIASRCG
jgi:hypothetical protein